MRQAGREGGREGDELALGDKLDDSGAGEQTSAWVGVSKRVHGWG